MLEPPEIRHRPLIFYALLYTAHFAVCGILRLAGFERKTLIAPLTPAATLGRRQREGQAFEYFHHPGLAHSTSLLGYVWRHLPNAKLGEAQMPIVFLCGLGGLTCIVHAALYLLLQTGRPLFLVGQPAVSMRLKSVGPRPRTRSDVFTADIEDDSATWQPIGSRHQGARASVPGLDLQTRGLRLMLERHGGHASAVFVSHSLGTGLAAFAARHDPKMLATSILVDPIAFLPYHSHLVKVREQPSLSGRA
jgi:hypothetical protein